MSFRPCHRCQSGRRAVVLHLACLLFVGLIPATPTLAMSTTDITRVANPDQPLHGYHELVLQEQWRVGDDEDDEGEGDTPLLSLPMDIAFDSRGQLYLLDLREQHVLVFSSSGKFIRTLGSRGEGPGQTRAAGGIFLSGDDTLSFVEMLPLRLVRILTDGTPLPSILLQPDQSSATAIPVAVRPGGDRLAMLLQEFSVDAEHHRLRRKLALRLFRRGNGAYIATLAERELSVDPGNPDQIRERDLLVPEMAFDVDRDGCTHVSLSRDSYRIGVYDREGHLTCLHEREYRPYHRRGGATSITRAELYALAKSYQIRRPDIEMDKTELTILQILCRPDGTTWVLTGRGRGDLYQRSMLPFVTFDVVSPDGHFLRQERIRCPGNPLLDKAFFAPDNRVAIIRNFWSSILSATTGGGIVNVNRDDEPIMLVVHQPSPTAPIQ